MSRVAVVGYGSIGARHARILGEIGCEVAVVSRRPDAYDRCYATIEDALERHQPEYLVIANEASRHRAALDEIEAAGFAGPVLVEKPLFDTPEPGWTTTNPNLFVAYNLRFHPLLLELKKRTDESESISAEIHVGQHLPTWRPDRDYRETAAARRGAGGGVLRELSHEFDYLNWLVGRWQRLTALGGRFSELEIDTEDIFSVLLVTDRCRLASVTMNFLDRNARRHILLNTRDDTLFADLVAGTLESGATGKLDGFAVERDYTYRAEHEAVLSGRHEELCTFSEGLEVVGLIDGAERAAKERRWIER